MPYAVLITGQQFVLVNILRAAVCNFQLQLCEMKQIEHSQTWPECTCRSIEQFIYIKIL